MTDTLHLIPVQRPFQIVGVDVMDLSCTEQGNRHMVVFQDMICLLIGRWYTPSLIRHDPTSKAAD